MSLLKDEEIVEVLDKQFGGSQWRDGWEIPAVVEEGDRAICQAQADLTRKEIADYMFKLETLKQFHELRSALKFGNFEALRLGREGE